MTSQITKGKLSDSDYEEGGRKWGDRHYFERVLMKLVPLVRAL